MLQLWEYIKSSEILFYEQQSDAMYYSSLDATPFLAPTRPSPETIQKTVIGTLLALAGLCLLAGISSVVSAVLDSSAVFGLIGLVGFYVLGAIRTKFDCNLGLAVVALRVSILGAALAPLISGIVLFFYPKFNRVLADGDGFLIVLVATNLVCIFLLSCAIYAAKSRRQFPRENALLIGCGIDLFLTFPINQLFGIPPGAALFGVAGALFLAAALVGSMENVTSGEVVGVKLSTLLVFARISCLFEKGRDRYHMVSWDERKANLSEDSSKGDVMRTRGRLRTSNQPLSKPIVTAISLPAGHESVKAFYSSDEVQGTWVKPFLSPTRPTAQTIRETVVNTFLLYAILFFLSGLSGLAVGALRIADGYALVCMLLAFILFAFSRAYDSRRGLAILAVGFTVAGAALSTQMTGKIIIEAATHRRATADFDGLSIAVITSLAVSVAMLICALYAASSLKTLSRWRATALVVLALPVLLILAKAVLGFSADAWLFGGANALVMVGWILLNMDGVTTGESNGAVLSTLLIFNRMTSPKSGRLYMVPWDERQPKAE